jgi:MFS family permease
MIREYLRTLRRFNRSVRLYLLATGLLGFAIDGGVYTVIFNLYLLRLGFGPEYIGQANSAGLLAFALSCLPAGAIGSRYGNRRMMLVGLVLTISGGLMLPAAQWFASQWLGAAIMAGFVVLYVGLALYFVNSVPFVVDITRPDERNAVFSMQTALLALAAFSGALVGGFLPRLFSAVTGIAQQQPAPYQFPLVFATVLMIPALWAIFATRRSMAVAAPRAEESHTRVESATSGHAAPQWGEGAVITTVILLSLVRFFQVGGIATTATFFNVYMDAELGVATMNIGILAAIGRLLAVPAALLTPLFAARWGAPRTVFWASTATALSLLPLALIPTWGAAAGGFFGVTALASVRYPAFLTYSMDQVPPAWRTTLAGAGETAGGLCFALMAFVGGYVIAGPGYTTLFMLGAAMALLGAVLFRVWFGAARPKRVPAPVA